MKQKLKIIQGLYIIFFMVLLLGCTQKDIDSKPNIVGDPTFERGFNLTNMVSYNKFTIPIDYLGEVSVNPIWEIVQWGVLDEVSRGDSYDVDAHNLHKGIEEINDDIYTIKTTSGSKVVNVDLNSGAIDLILNSQLEYGDVPRQSEEDWPHLLIQQHIGQHFFLSDLKHVYVDIELELLNYEKFADLDTAQFQWIFNIANKNPNSQGNRERDYYWFNITYFDARDYEANQVAKGGSLIDGGKADATGKFIYQADARAFMDGKLEVKNKVRITYDFLPEMIEAFHMAQSEYGALQTSQFEDMALDGFNIGWEVPGLYDVGIRITDLAIRVVEE